MAHRPPRRVRSAHHGLWLLPAKPPLLRSGRLEQTENARAVWRTVGPMIALDAGDIVSGGIVGPVRHCLGRHGQPAVVKEDLIVSSVRTHRVMSAIGHVTAQGLRVPGTCKLRNHGAKVMSAPGGGAAKADTAISRQPLMNRILTTMPLFLAKCAAPPLSLTLGQARSGCSQAHFVGSRGHLPASFASIAPTTRHKPRSRALRLDGS